MNILMINKFLRPVGGAETYLLKLGAYLEKTGHTVNYFGMEHPDNCVGNVLGLSTAHMDFHDGSSLWEKLTYPPRVIHSSEAEKKLYTLLCQTKPDVVHLNNFNYQLTPSVLLAVRKYRQETKRNVRVLYTARDAQLVCPSHLLYHPATHTVCERCLGGHYLNCIGSRCIHGSAARSCLGTLEAVYWRIRRIYETIDVILCPSAFMKRCLDTDPILAEKTVVLRNFVERPAACPSAEAAVQMPDEKTYVLYFGRYAEEKGLRTLLAVCESLPGIPFVFAGGGPLAQLVDGTRNVRNVGFLGGDALNRIIRGARFSVYPSEWAENCPFSVLESIAAGTPVLGADRGGIPELIEENRTGWLFPAGNADALRAEILRLWNSDLPKRCADGCRAASFDDLDMYAEKLMEYYRGSGVRHTAVLD